MLEHEPPGDARGGQAYRPLPLVPVLHDDLPVRRALHASGRPRPRPHREDLQAPARRPRHARAARARADRSGLFRLAAAAGLLAQAVRAGVEGARTDAARSDAAAHPARSLPAPPADRPQGLSGAGPAARRASRCSPAASIRCCRRRPTSRHPRCSTAHGVEVVIAAGEACCGSLVHHMGREDQALAQARNNIDAWTREIEGGGARRHPDHGVRAAARR